MLKEKKHIKIDIKSITISTWITILRIFMVPVIAYSLYFNYWITSCILLFLAGISDILDGAIARYRNEETALGACLDPIADKILIISSYFTLVFVKTPLPKLFLIFILLKEFLQIAGAAFFVLFYDFISIKANFWGKITTVFQISFIAWLCLSLSLHRFCLVTFWSFLGLIVILNIITLLSYALVGFKGLQLWQKID